MRELVPLMGRVENDVNEEPPHQRVHPFRTFPFAQGTVNASRAPPNIPWEPKWSRPCHSCRSSHLGPHVRANSSNSAPSNSTSSRCRRATSQDEEDDVGEKPNPNCLQMSRPRSHGCLLHREGTAGILEYASLTPDGKGT